jgi:hypothetical protein
MNLFPALADKIERDPALIGEARRTLRRWMSEHPPPAAGLRQWDRILAAAERDEAGRRALLDLLRDESEPARRLKDFAPLAGLLSREERRRVFLSCTYDH